MPCENHRATNVSDATGIINAGTDNVVNAGDTISYSFDVTNTGHTCLAVISIVDDNAGEVACTHVVDTTGEGLRQYHTVKLWVGCAPKFRSA